MYCMELHHFCTDSHNYTHLVSQKAYILIQYPRFKLFEIYGNKLYIIIQNNFPVKGLFKNVLRLTVVNLCAIEACKSR